MLGPVSVAAASAVPATARPSTAPSASLVLMRREFMVGDAMNHETSKVPFPYNATAPTAANGENDFDNAQVSRLILNQHSAGVLNGSFVIPSSSGYQRFCSNYLATEKEGFDGKSSSRTRSRPTTCTGRRPPGRPPREPAEREAGAVVALDVKTGKHHPIYGMGRHNHENNVAIPGYGHPVVSLG